MYCFSKYRVLRNEVFLYSLGTNMRRNVEKNALNANLESFQVGKKFLRTFLLRVYVPLYRFPENARVRIKKPMIIRTMTNEIRNDTYLPQSNVKKHKERTVSKFNNCERALTKHWFARISRLSDVRLFENAIKVRCTHCVGSLQTFVRNNTPC